MILGDSLQVMASLAEREGLRGKLQCIYSIRLRHSFDSNFNGQQPQRVRDKIDNITREPSK